MEAAPPARSGGALNPSGVATLTTCSLFLLHLANWEASKQQNKFTGNRRQRQRILVHFSRLSLLILLITTAPGNQGEAADSERLSAVVRPYRRARSLGQAGTQVRRLIVETHTHTA